MVGLPGPTILSDHEMRRLLGIMNATPEVDWDRAWCVVMKPKIYARVTVGSIRYDVLVRLR
jgi:hypothetical protein